MSKIFISVGHGGSDVGAVAIDGSYEKDIALKIGLFLYYKYRNNGFFVYDETE